MPTTAPEERMPVYGPAATEKQIRQRSILPVDFCLRDEAKRHVLDGLAVWKNRTKAIQMLKMPQELVIRGESCKVDGGQRDKMKLMDLYVEGVKRARKAVDAWETTRHRLPTMPGELVYA